MTEEVDPAAMALLAERALAEVRDGAVVGLGSGRAASAFVRALGERMRAGFRARGVPTSHDTATPSPARSACPSSASRSGPST